MSSQPELKRILAILESMTSESNLASEFWRLVHPLAENQNPEVIPFIERGLDDKNWLWRETSLQLLGFHYKLEENSIQRIRRILINDPSNDVRMTAASVLGVQSSLPDTALYQALRSDKNKSVRDAAYSAILDLMGIPRQVVQKEVQKARKSKDHFDLEQIREIAIREERFEYLDKLMG